MKRYKVTIIGSSFLLLLLIVSLLYPLYGAADFHETIFPTDQHGNIIGKAPFPPSKEHLLGTDRNGRDMVLLMLFGVKFTLITAFGVAFLRVLFGGIFGIFLSLWAPFLKPYFMDFFLSFRYIPSILIALILMLPIAGFYTGVSLTSVVTYQVIILVFLGFPSVTLFMTDVTELLLKTSFVKSSYLMGASRMHVLRRQLFPFLRSYGILSLTQQFINTMQILMHLGMMGIFLGGQNIEGVFGYDPPKPSSLSVEWAGFIGQNFNEFVMAPWIIFELILGCFLIIFIVNMMKKEIEDNMTEIRRVEKIRKKKPDTRMPSGVPADDGLEFVHKGKLEA